MELLDAIFSVGVRINLMDVVKGKENVLLATTMNTSKLEQTISSVLGSKFLASLTPITIDLTGAVDPASPKGDWRIDGYVSKAPATDNNKNSENKGAVKAGQIFFSINGRPVELPKLARTLNEVWRTLGGKKKPSCVLTLTLPNEEFDVNLSPEKRQVLLTNEVAICESFRIGIESIWVYQTEGQFTANASRPVAQQAARKPDINSIIGKSPPPIIDNIEDLQKIQASNRKRALEKHARIPLAPTRRRNDIEEMSVDSQDDDDDDDEESDPEEAEISKRAYMRKFREEQYEQRQLNSQAAAAGVEYGEDNDASAAAAAAEYDKEASQPEEDVSPRRIRRRGGFVHDITKAKSFDQSSNHGIGFEIPEGIEDPDANEDDAEHSAEAPNKKQRMVNISTDDSPAAHEEVVEEKERMAVADRSQDSASSRRVTVSMNNDIPTGSIATSPRSAQIVTASDGDKLLWTKVQANFNSVGEGHDPEKDIDTLVKTSASPEKLLQTQNQASPQISDNSSSELNLGQFAFRSTPSQTSTSPDKSTNRHEQLTPTSSRGREKTAKRRKSNNGQQYTATDTSSSADDAEEDSIDPVPHSVVVWDSYQGTESVVAMTKYERKQMLDRKRKLRGAQAGQGCDDADDGTDDITDKLERAKVSLVKGSFGDMEILGQFNLGFILAKDPKNQLWILDQHACDERINFERLMKETILQNQTLIQPMPLELDPSEESCVLDNMEMFEKNGFKFKYDETKEPRHRLALTAMPHSGAHDGRKAVNFGKEDVSALCAILGVNSSSAFDNDAADYANSGTGGGTGADGSGLYGNNAVRRYAGSQLTQGDEADKVITRLPKAIAMFASRACRGSVMIGTSLSKKEMEKVMKGLDNLDTPFACAHGRPTMTHVTDLQSELLQDEQRLVERIAGPTMATSLTQSDDMDTDL